METITRRHFALIAGGAFATFALGDACIEAGQSREFRDGRFTTRPRRASTNALKSGPLGLGSGERDGVVQVPSTPPPERGFPLLLFLHGATQNGARMLQRVGPAADQMGVAVLDFPDYRGSSHSRGYVLPAPYLVYRGDFFKSDRSGARTTFFSDQNFDLHLSVGASLPVSSDRNPDREGMPALRPSIELGPALDVTLWRSARERYKLDAVPK